MNWPRWGAQLTSDVVHNSSDSGATDVLTPEQRHLVMSRIKGKHTRPEMLIRRGLHRRGLRYRLHGKGILGRPDLVFPKYHTVVFINGCFWHGHGCSLFKWPKSRARFWKGKIHRNMERDRDVVAALNADGWRVLVIWECALKGKQRQNLTDVLSIAEAFIRNSQALFVEVAEHD